MDDKTDYEILYEVFNKYGIIESSGNYKNGGCFFQVDKNFSDDESEKIRFEFDDHGNFLSIFDWNSY